MKPLVLTGWLMPDFMENDLADLVLNLDFFNFVWGPQPSPGELATHLALAPGVTTGTGPHTGRTGAPTGAKTEGAVIGAWPNSASNTKPSNYGSTYGRARS